MWYHNHKDNDVRKDGYKFNKAFFARARALIFTFHH